MAKSIENLERKVRSRPGAEERINARTEAMRVGLRLAEIRKELDATQTSIALLMATTQENISRIERTDNPYLSTVADFVAALGGRLEINAVFDDRVISLAAVEREISDSASPVAGSSG